MPFDMRNSPFDGRVFGRWEQPAGLRDQPRRSNVEVVRTRRGTTVVGAPPSARRTAGAERNPELARAAAPSQLCSWSSLSGERRSLARLAGPVRIRRDGPPGYLVGHQERAERQMLGRRHAGTRVLVLARDLHISAN